MSANSHHVASVGPQGQGLAQWVHRTTVVSEENTSLCVGPRCVTVGHATLCSHAMDTEHPCAGRICCTL
jgi:hypothetical protein